MTKGGGVKHLSSYTLSVNKIIKRQSLDVELRKGGFSN